MALTGEKDQYGNLYDSKGFWVGVGENEGEIYPSALGKWISVYDPQADIFMSQPEPKAASTGGGGGSTNPQTIYIQQNPGGLYQTITSDGSDGFPPGTVYQKNQVTGDFNILYKPSAQSDPASLYNDRNGDGYDDQTGLPVGVTKVDKSLSPTGLVYQGKPVNADGSLYTGGSTGGLDFSNVRTVGGNTYVLDTKTGQYVLAPGLPVSSGPGSTSSGGGSYTISGPKVSSYSGGGGGSSSSAADQAAAYAQQTQMQKDAQAFTASQNALDRAQKDAQFQANYGLSVAQFNAQQAAQAKQQKSQDLKDFGNAVSDVDPAQFAAFLYANGFPAGGTIANRIAEGGTAISANALVRAAGLLDSIRNGNQATQYGGSYGGGLGNTMPGTGAPGGATPGATGATGGLGNTGGTGTPVLPSTQANQAGTKGGAIDPNIAANIAAGQQEQQQQAYAADKAATLAWYNPANWTEVPGPDMTSGMRYMQSTLTGEKVPIGVWTDMIQNNMGASQKETQNAQFWSGASITPDSGGIKTYFANGIPKSGVDSLGQAYGMSSQTIDPYALPNYTGPGAMNLNGDNIQREAPTGTVQPRITVGGVGTDATQPTGFSPGQAVPEGTLASGYAYDPNTNTYIQKLARGGLAQGPYISGDSLDNRPNPELNIPTPMGNHVIPLRQMPQGLAQQMMATLPRHAEGTVQDLNSSWLSSQSYNPFNDPFARFIPANAVTQPATTAGSGTTTTTPSTPVSSPASPAPAPAVSSTSTGLGNTTTAPSPAAATTQSTQPAPTNAQGQTIQQPTAPAPVTGGLGSITDIVNSGTTTPTSQALLDEILKWRQGQEVLPVNPLSLDFQNLDPYTQQIIYNQRQTKYGIPVAAQQYEVNKFRIPGASRGSLAGGLAW